MYWRVRRLDPNYIMRKWGVWIAIAVSVPLNLFLILTRPNLNKIISGEQKQNFDQFARNVTNHLLDSSYITFEQNTNALLNGELAPSLVARLKKDKQLPASSEETQATVQALRQTREVDAVRIDQVNVGDPTDNGFLPIDVTGVMAKHSAEEGGPQETPFHIKYFVGTNAQTQQPLVVDMQG